MSNRYLVLNSNHKVTPPQDNIENAMFHDSNEVERFIVEQAALHNVPLTNFTILVLAPRSRCYKLAAEPVKVVYKWEIQGDGTEESSS